MLAVPGAEDLLIACGFQAGHSTEGLQLEAPNDYCLSLLHGALMLLAPEQPASDAAQLADSASVSPELAMAMNDTADHSIADANEARAAGRADPLQAANHTAGPAAAQGTGAAASVRKEQLGMPPEQWKAQAGGSRSVAVGGAAVTVQQQAPGKSLPPAAAPDPQAGEPALAEAFTGRNTKVGCALPISICALC